MLSAHEMIYFFITAPFAG